MVTLRGFHFYNSEEVDFEERGREFTRNTLVRSLREWTVNRNGVETPVGKIGISHPIVVNSIPVQFRFDPNARHGQNSLMSGAGFPGGMGMGMAGGAYPGDLEGGGMPMAGGMAGGAMGFPGMGGAGMGPAAAGMPFGGAAAGMPIGGAAAGMPFGGGEDMLMAGKGGPGPGVGPGFPGAGFPGAGMPGGAVGTGGRGNVVFDEQERSELQMLEQTRFVLQFVWKPTIERDRLPERPAESSSTADASAAATGAATGASTGSSTSASSGTSTKAP